MNYSTQEQQFEFFSEFFEGMDGKEIIAKQIQTCQEYVSRTGDGVDFAIAAAIIEAKDYDNGTVGDVVMHLNYIINELTKFRDNLRKE